MDSMKELLKKADRCYKNKNYADALNIYEELSRKNGIFPETAHGAGLCLYRLKNFKSAAEKFHKVINLISKNETLPNEELRYSEGINPEMILRESMLLVGFCHRENKQWKETADVFQKYLETFNPGVETRKKLIIMIAGCYEELSDWKHAASCYYELSEIDKNSTELDEHLIRIGFCLESAKEFEPAIKAYHKLISERENSKYVPQCYFRTANCYFMQGIFLTAEEIIEELISKFPEHQITKSGKRLLSKCREKQRIVNKSISAYNS